MWLNLIKTFFKSIINYFKKNIVRQSGVFGISGSFKSLGGFKKVIQNKKYFEVVKKIAKKNVLRSLHGTNFILDLKKFGWKETLKRTAKNRLVPMEARKLGWYMNSLKHEIGREKMKKDLRDKLLFNATKNTVKITNKDGLKQIDTIDRALKLKTRTKGEKDLKDELTKKTLVFNVSSPESHNFSQRLHFYNLQSKDYTLPIRGWRWSGTNPRIKYYTYHRVPWKHIRNALLKMNFGRVVFSQIR